MPGTTNAPRSAQDSTHGHDASDVLESVDGTGGIRIPLSDARYPPLLREIHDPPEHLYVRGNPAVLQRPQLAIVGSRRASVGGLKLTRILARQLSRAGLGICSGLAQGIDGAAHRGALDGSGMTVAVVGTGVDVVYPRQHQSLARELLQQGCIVSEFPPGTPARPGHFPQRNRLISGMSVGVLVVEAAPRSGSLITARLALEQGRAVFALPWSLLHEGGRGCLELIRDGARLVLDPEDIAQDIASLVSLTPLPDSVAEDMGATQVVLSDGEQQLLALMGDRTCSTDELAAASGWSFSELVTTLSGLEIAGHVVQVAGGYCRQ